MIIGTVIKIGDLTVTAFEAPHDECIRKANALCINNINDHLQIYENYGFYDVNGKFYSREEAAKHAFECGQLPHADGTTSQHYDW